MLVKNAVVFFLLAGSLIAEKLTLPEVLDLADQQHPLLRAGAAQVDGATAGIRTAQGYPNPETTLIAGRQTGQGPGGPTNGVPLAALSQPLELGSLRPSRIQFATRARESSSFFLAEVRLRVLSQVRRAFYGVLRRRGAIQIANENLVLVQDLRNRIQVRVDVGEIGRLELVRAEAEVASARTLSASAQMENASALAQFRAAVGGPLAADLDLDGSLDPPVQLPPFEQLRTEAEERHPTLALARSEVRRAEARVGYETALRRPQPALRTEVDMSGPSYRFGIIMPLNLWNKREGPIAEAAAGLRQAAYEAEARQIEILAALEEAYQHYQISQQQVTAFEQGLIREAEEALRAAETAYQLGERGILEVLDAQRVLRSVRLNFLNAQFDRQAALIDLDELRAIDLRSNSPRRNP
jgi:cobalt-zinc-cadmium efflux system outer membrane protein